MPAALVASWGLLLFLGSCLLAAPARAQAAPGGRLDALREFMRRREETEQRMQALADHRARLAVRASGPADLDALRAFDGLLAVLRLELTSNLAAPGLPPEDARVVDQLLERLGASSAVSRVLRDFAEAGSLGSPPRAEAFQVLDLYQDWQAALYLVAAGHNLPDLGAAPLPSVQVVRRLLAAFVEDPGPPRTQQARAEALGFLDRIGCLEVFTGGRLAASGASPLASFMRGGEAPASTLAPALVEAGRRALGALGARAAAGWVAPRNLGEAAGAWGGAALPRVEGLEPSLFGRVLARARRLEAERRARRARRAAPDAATGGAGSGTPEERAGGAAGDGAGSEADEVQAAGDPAASTSGRGSPARPEGEAAGGLEAAGEAGAEVAVARRGRGEPGRDPGASDLGLEGSARPGSGPAMRLEVVAPAAVFAGLLALLGVGLVLADRAEAKGQGGGPEADPAATRARADAAPSPEANPTVVSDRRGGTATAASVSGDPQEVSDAATAPPATRLAGAPAQVPGAEGGQIPTWLSASLQESLGDRYQLRRVLGAGGMGTVCLAEDSRLGRKVAIKVPPPHLVGDPEFRQRFLREAQALARLDHRNVTRVYDVPAVQAPAIPVMVLEYLEGTDLHERLRRAGPGKPHQVAAWVRDAAEGLTHAHGLGVFHRDVKPANLMLTPEGVVKVLDFGLAALGDERPLTRSGVLMGSLPYMSPEQLRGQRVGASTDQFSLAATAFQLLTGHLPFGRDETQREVVPRARDRRPDLPPEVDAVLGRGMATQPEDRFPSVRALALALADSVGAGEGRPGPLGAGPVVAGAGSV